MASYLNHVDVVEALLKAKGIDVNKAGTCGTTNDQPSATPLYHASSRGHVGVVEALLKMPGIDVNAARKYDDSTPLSIASRMGHVGVVEALLDAPGIDVNAARNDGSTPLSLASHVGHVDVVKALLDAPGLDLDGWNANGKLVALAAAVKAEGGHKWKEVLEAMRDKLVKKLKEEKVEGGGRRSHDETHRRRMINRFNAWVTDIRAPPG